MLPLIENLLHFRQWPSRSITAQSPFTLVQLVQKFPHQWSGETCFQHRQCLEALNYRPDLFHEGNSIHITSRPILVVSVMNFPPVFGQRSKERYPAVPSVLLLLGDSYKNFFSAFSELLAELLSSKFWFISTKADRSSSVEDPSSAGSVVPSNVSVPFSKVAEEVEVQAGHPACRSLVVLFLSLIGILLHRFFRSTVSSLLIVSLLIFP